MDRLAKILGTTKNGVIHQAARLEVKRAESSAVKRHRKAGTLWTEEEREFLRKNYHRMSTARLSAEMGRPMCTIWEYAMKMGLPRKKKIARKKIKPGVVRARPWTDWEKQFLIETHDIMYWKQMQENGLFRCERSIWSQMDQLGLIGKHLKKEYAYGIFFYYITEEEKQAKWQYIHFWKEVTQHGYAQTSGYRYCSGEEYQRA